MVSFFCGKESKGRREKKREREKTIRGSVGNLVHICVLMSDNVREFHRKGSFHDHTRFSLSHSFK